ncbi:MAG TPA: hypothetical protein VMV51_03180 [Gemmatimonadaceae bacterium]|nr:hypothetical protein [Gemmatimonadaceae bacterium]
MDQGQKPEQPRPESAVFAGVDVKTLQPDPGDLDWISVEDRLPEVFPACHCSVSKVVTAYSGPQPPTPETFDYGKWHPYAVLEQSMEGRFHWALDRAWEYHGVTHWAEIPASWCRSPLREDPPASSAADPPSR